MTSIVWTHQALEDIESIHLFIARDSERYAAMMAERILDSIERLRDFPKSGRIVPEVGCEELRELLIGAYRVVYRCGENRVTILTVVHGAQLLSP